jgi:hydroxybutyrate-dimer hydrolase
MQTQEPAGTPSGVTLRANRCASLKDKGLLKSGTVADQATEALAVINSYGLLSEANVMLPVMTYAGAYKQIIATYPSDAGRFQVQDNLCGISFAATDASLRPAPLAGVTAANLFAAGNIVPPSGGINLINDRAVEGSILEQAGTSPSTGRQDLNIDGDLCFRALVAGGSAAGDDSNAQRVRQGVLAQRASGKLHGLRTLILQGRADEVLAPNATGRAYYGLNQVTNPDDSKVSYIEVTNAQHLDSAISGLSPHGVAAFVPLHHYYTQALDLMLASLKNDSALPSSQVVHAKPRGTTALTADTYTSFLPDIAATPAAADAITFANGAVSIPE